MFIGLTLLRDMTIPDIILMSPTNSITLTSNIPTILLHVITISLLVLLLVLVDLIILLKNNIRL